MMERKVKKENPFKDHILGKLLGKKDRQEEILTNGFENQNSVQQNSTEITKNDVTENNGSVEIGFSKNFSAPGCLKDNKEIDESTKIPGKIKQNFKSMTLDRMGKMLKFRETNSNHCEPTNNERNENETRTIFYPYDQPSHKVKTNSLGRMLKLMDKDINSKKIFTPSTSKLSKTSQKPKSNDEEKCKTEDSIRRAFSKMISQIRKGRSKNEKTPAEPNIRIPKEEKSKDSRPPRTPFATRIISSLSSSPSRLSAIKKSTPLTHDPTSSTSEIP